MKVINLISKENKFCPYCYNSKATDGSYQELGCYVIMDRIKIEGWNGEGYYSYELWECSECGHQQDVKEVEE